jgi:transcriptional regulator with XRE-family HTH domain
MVQPVIAVKSGIWNRQLTKTKNGRTGMSLGARITKLRLKAGQSLQEVADAVGVSKAHIWELEKGRADNPSMGLVTRLADHFEVSVAFLVGEDRAARDADPKLAGMFRQASKLEPAELALLQDMLQSLLKHRPRKR